MSSKSNTDRIEHYKKQLIVQQSEYLNLNSDDVFKELFNGTIIMFIKEILILYNKLTIQHPELKTSHCAEKISNLNMLLRSLEGDGKLLGINCNEFILKAYINYCYLKYREILQTWDILKIKSINENNIKSAVIDTASKETVLSKASEHLNIIPEIITMINNLHDKEILKILFYLNNLNLIVDIYLVKESNKK
jgi:hypothetical protein